MLGSYCQSLKDLYSTIVVRLAVEYHGCTIAGQRPCSNPSPMVVEHDRLNTAYFFVKRNITALQQRIRFGFAGLRRVLAASGDGTAS